MQIVKKVQVVQIVKKKYSIEQVVGIPRVTASCQLLRLQPISTLLSQFNRGKVFVQKFEMGIFGQICLYGHIGTCEKNGQVGYPLRKHQKCNSETLTSGP